MADLRSSPRIHAVVHVSDAVDPAQEVSTALAHGASGCFLIDHDLDDERLVRAIRDVRSAHPDAFLGANVIKRSPARSLEILATAFDDRIPLDAVWTDSAGVGLDGQDAEHRAFIAMRERLGWEGLQFGGVAFKYQAPVADEDLAALGRVCATYVDVPTTSGPGTGQAASARKLELLRVGMGTHPLALASGVTPENVLNVAHLVDHILVSTGIASASGGIDPRLLEELVANAAVRPTD